MHTKAIVHSAKSSLVMTLLAALVVGSLISNGFALMPHKIHQEPCSTEA